MGIRTRRVGALTATLTLLVASGVARAASSTATAREMAWARRVAVAYWHGEPRCGIPTVSPSKGLGNLLGDATYSTCAIRYSAGTSIDWGWREYPPLFCELIVHEYGHLVLGPTYFAASNPTEPEHSPDPRSIMYWETPERFAPCGAKSLRQGI